MRPLITDGSPDLTADKNGWQGCCWVAAEEYPLPINNLDIQELMLSHNGSGRTPIPATNPHLGG
jgi:hypothetical protein